MTTTLLLDFAGVLAKGRMWSGIAEMLAERSDVSEEEIIEACYAGEEGISLGKESVLVFWARSIRPLGISYADYVHAHTSWYELDHFLLGFLESIADRYALVLASDNFPLLSDRIRNDPGLQLLDAMYFSNELHVSKKHSGPAFFNAIIEDLGIDKDDCHFFDDKQKNVDASIAAGIPATLYEGDVDVIKHVLLD